MYKNIVLLCEIEIPSESMATRYSSSATLSAAFLGATTLATASYLSSAITHLQRPSHARDACRMRSGTNSGFGM